MITVRRVLLSGLSGFLILAVTWIYQNYDFSSSLEDGFFKKISPWRYKVFPPELKQTAPFVFINTGKDLALVEDSVDYGNVAISDREKIYHLLRYIDGSVRKPLFTVLDLQLYYPYTVNPAIDSQMAAVIAKNDRLIIPVVKNKDGTYKRPLYAGRYAYSDYRTFSSGFNKFRILNQSKIGVAKAGTQDTADRFRSIPIALHEALNGARYTDRMLYATCNGRLCLSSIWPTYYLTNNNLRFDTQAHYAQYYNLGEVLMDMDANPDSYAKFFHNKIVLIGNFDEDVHATTVGRMSGPVLLADIYLSLLNGQHLVNGWFFLLQFVVFSALSYVAWFGRMPELKLNFKFLLSSYLTKFIRTYVSYFGSMFLLSLLVLILFNVQVALFLPSFIYTWIEYFRHKKYRTAPEKKEAAK